jgi:hypothetical protein
LVRAIRWRLGGEAFLLPVSGFPLAATELTFVKYFVNRIVAGTIGDGTLEVFIQLTQFGGGKKRLAAHGSEWVPELGLGVWPDRPAPTLWTEEDIANLIPGSKLRPLMHQVLRIAGSAREDASNKMLDLGTILQIVTQDNDKRLLERTRERLLPSIKEPSLRNFPFYVPLLERKSLESAAPEQLEDWFCGATAYIRESFEDNGILVASREPLTPMLMQLGGKFEPHPEPVWHVPAPSSL